MSYIGGSVTKPYIGKRGTAGTTTTTPIVVERGPFDTWLDLPVTGLRRGELVDVNDMTGSPRGYTGDGSAMWDGEDWVEQGGTPPETVSGSAKVSVLAITVAAPSVDLTVNAASAGHGHSGATDHDLGADQAAFLQGVPPDILINGRSVKHDTRLSYLSATSVRWAGDVNPGDVFEAHSPS